MTFISFKTTATFCAVAGALFQVVSGATMTNSYSCDKANGQPGLDGYAYLNNICSTLPSAWTSHCCGNNLLKANCYECWLRFDSEIPSSDYNKLAEYCEKVKGGKLVLGDVCKKSNSPQHN